MEELTVWVFNGPKHFRGFPSGVFVSLELGEEWIRRNNASGTLTRYPVNVGVYEWAIANGFFKPKKAEHTQATFIESFSSTRQERYYYDQGQLAAG